MPNRILMESVCTSDSINGLSWFEEVLFYRLIVNCDDYGRFDGRVAVIKNRLFPLKDGITAKSVEAGINRLVRVGLVALYVFEGKPFLYLPTWNDHQTVRAKKSRYPAPEAEGDSFESIASQVESCESICKQMKSDAGICSRNPIQSESYSESESVSDASVFERFWEVYPKKVGKKDAMKAFGKVRENVQVLIDAVNRQKLSSQWCRDSGQYIPNPATWLNQERWNDVLDTNMGRKVPCGASGTLGAAELEAIQRVLREEES